MQVEGMVEYFQKGLNLGEIPINERVVNFLFLHHMMTEIEYRLWYERNAENTVAYIPELSYDKREFHIVLNEDRDSIVKEMKDKIIEQNVMKGLLIK